MNNTHPTPEGQEIPLQISSRKDHCQILKALYLKKDAIKVIDLS